MNDKEQDVFLHLLRRRLKFLDSGHELDMNHDLKSLGLDSMTSVDLLFDIEDAFNVTLPDEYIVEQTFSTAATLWQTVSSLKKEGQS